MTAWGSKPKNYYPIITKIAVSPYITRIYGYFRYELPTGLEPVIY